MSTKKYAEFLNAIAAGNFEALIEYKDPDFRDGVSRYVIDRLTQMLLATNVLRLHAMISRDQLFLTSILNTRDAVTNLNILDLCLMARFSDMAEVIALLGCRNSIPINDFKAELDRLFPEQDDPIKAEFTHTFQGMDSSYNNRARFNMSQRRPGRTKWQFASKVSFGTTILMLLAGVGCLAAIPFTGGISGAVGGVLLASAGIPAVFTAASSCREGLSTEQSADGSNNENRNSLESATVEQLHQMLHKHHEALAPQSVYSIDARNGSSAASCNHIRHSSVTMLNAMNLANEAKEEILRSPRASQIPKLTFNQQDIANV